MIGYYGDIIFESSDQRILTFTGLKHDSSGRWEKHNIIGQKPISEFVGPDLDTVTFTINLNGSTGIKPRDEMEKWLQIVKTGTADVLVIGSKILGEDKWAVKSVSQAWDTIFNRGELFSGKIDVTLEEYIESITTTVDNGTSSKTDLSTLSDSIKALQYDLNVDYNAKISQSGVADKDTMSALNGIQSLIVKGHKSSVVLWIQQKLIGYGYLKKGQYTGTYDETTFQAVTNMQKNWGRATDGVLRLETWTIFLNN